MLLQIICPSWILKEVATPIFFSKRKKFLMGFCPSKTTEDKVLNSVSNILMLKSDSEITLILKVP